MEEMGGAGREDEDECAEQENGAVYCAVGKEPAKEWKANLRWVLANFPRRSRLVLVHVHRPPNRINMMGAWVPVSQLAEQQVAAYRQLEEEKMSKVLDDLLDVCKSQQVQARKIIIAGDDTARGLVQLIDDHGVAELVMGAAGDRWYTRKMRAPRSKKALTVQRKANPSCKIWFVCRGNLICTRENSEGLNRAGSSTPSSTSPRSISSDYSRSKSSPRLHSEPSIMHESTMPSLHRNPNREDDDSAVDHSIDDDLDPEAALVAGSSAMPASEIVEADGVSLQEVEDGSRTSSHDDSEHAGEMDEALYEKLRNAFMEAENLRHEAYEETRRRQKAERDLADASRIAKDAEISHQREAKHRKEMEERLARERAAMEQDRQELDGILEQIRKVDDRSAELELQITSSERMMGDLEAKLSESYKILHTLRRERRQEDTAAPISGTSSAMDTADQRASFLRLGCSELQEATNHFDDSARIGGAGGRGGVYRGSLRGMKVAVKRFSPGDAVDEARFAREVEAIGRARHPHLVALVGACPEARAVVYEFVPGGSLEDRLGDEGGAAPLPWHARCGVAHRACSALAFLHSRTVVHGDVRPANILLEDERGSSGKLAGLGMCRLVAAAARPGSTAALAYLHPEYLATGELTPQCDVYALGVVLLRLVTGKPAFAAKKAAQEAADGSKGWQDVVDAASAGGWPTERAREVALLGLRLCDVKRTPRRRPGELLEEARGVLEAAMSAAPGRSWSSLSSSSASDGVPAYFLCPILKEVMRDPQIAGDGFTYEAEAMREWLGSGHDTSPMTNLKLPTDELIPNHALRAAIQEWRHTRGA